MSARFAASASISLALRSARLGHRVADRWLFRDLSMSLAPGSFTAVIGRNGAGKSTLLRALAGLDAGGEGEVWLGESRLLDLSPGERARRLAYLPQRTPLYHDLSVRELVSLGRAPHLGRWGNPGAADREAVARALARVELTDLAVRPISTLSGGERQRAMLARMLATGAPILVLDEPCAALDIAHALTFMRIARELADGGHVIVVAIHDLELVRRGAAQVLCLGLDDEGGARVGEVREILDLELIRRAFGVLVEPTGGLAFALPDEPG